MNQNQDMIKQNITLVGCAKNEAAYLPEWIFWHLSLGFIKIIIYINNTTDDSVKILDKIKKIHPQVSYVIADNLIESPPQFYIEKTNENFFQNNRVQAVCYTDALIKNNDSDYLGFLDIDEFFFPLAKLEEIFPIGKDLYTIKKFSWVMLSGDKTNFCDLSKCRKGYLDDYYKSFVSVSYEDVRAEDPHTFSINGKTGIQSKEALILHRVLRSKNEYLNLLKKSTSNKKNILTNGFKRNRRGWTDNGADILNFGVKFSKDYSDNLKKFIFNCDITEEVEKARLNIVETADEVRKEINAIKIQNKELTRSLSGTGEIHIDISIFFHGLFWGMVRKLLPRITLSHKPISEIFKKK